MGFANHLDLPGRRQFWFDEPRRGTNHQQMTKNFKEHTFKQVRLGILTRTIVFYKLVLTKTNENARSWDTRYFRDIHWGKAEKLVKLYKVNYQKNTYQAALCLILKDRESTSRALSVRKEGLSSVAAAIFEPEAKTCQYEKGNQPIFCNSLIFYSYDMMDLQGIYSELDTISMRQKDEWTTFNFCLDV